MKALLWLIYACATLRASADIPQVHPLLGELVKSTDEIVVARQRPPQIWMTSELVVLTGQAGALVTRTVKGTTEPGKRIIFQVVRENEIGIEPIQPPSIPTKDAKFPKTPKMPESLMTTDKSEIPAGATEEILFLRHNRDGSLSAADGYVYSLPYTIELERAIQSICKFHAQQAGAGQPAIPVSR